MTPAEEYALYESDYATWLVQAAPRCAVRLALCNDADLTEQWELLSRDYQLAVWNLLDEAMRTRVRAVRADYQQGVNAP
jgi:hypothetical protein